jgi:hypothetical protein
MSLMLTQLIQYTGNLVDLWGLSNSNCLANFMSNDEEDNHDDVINTLLDNEELVVVNLNEENQQISRGTKGPFFDGR